MSSKSPDAAPEFYAAFAAAVECDPGLVAPAESPAGGRKGRAPSLRGKGVLVSLVVSLLERAGVPLPVIVLELLPLIAAGLASGKGFREVFREAFERWRGGAGQLQVVDQPEQPQPQPQ
jgi:hypothetical protein